MKEKALTILRQALKNQNANFQDGQWESIENVLEKKRTLVVQRTGWGKSMVYFLATKLLRLEGAGPTLIISPLLSLIRNQIDSASRLDLKAYSINSSNKESWSEVKNALDENIVDILFVSPERLANDEFLNDFLPNLIKEIKLFVVDEAHCISDWGHDFRPDYKRIVRIINSLPPSMAVLATTATANDRVVNDIKSQLGDNLYVQRGSLIRKSLKLQNITMPKASSRLAWLVEHIPSLPLSGIVYTLTQKDAEFVAEWLQLNNISAEAYHSDVVSTENNNKKLELEQKLITNEIKVLVATVALGMGFDKPDLGFVIHYQRPSSVVAYYQQIGRAGRVIDNAYGILFCGAEDDRIADYFIEAAFPPQEHIYKVLELLKEYNGLSTNEIKMHLNIKHSQLEKTLKFLSIEYPSPIKKDKTKYYLTETAENYSVDVEHIKSIKDIRYKEQKEMQIYMQEKTCLMNFLQKALDDPSAQPCGQCANCNPNQTLTEEFSIETAQKAFEFLKKNYQDIAPRKRWPKADMFDEYDFSGSKIESELMSEYGKALSIWQEALGIFVADGKTKDNYFNDILVRECLFMIKEWDIEFKWVTCVPSLNNPNLVSNFAKRLADELNLPFHPSIRKVKNNEKQKSMANSFQQAKNLDGAFTVDSLPLTDTCLLIDDTVSSGWTFTVISALLKKAGVEKVYPLALAVDT